MIFNEYASALEKPQAWDVLGARPISSKTGVVFAVLGVGSPARACKPLGLHEKRICGLLSEPCLLAGLVKTPTAGSGEMPVKPLISILDMDSSGVSGEAAHQVVNSQRVLLWSGRLYDRVI